jgi:Flp pilus assembly CpaE family ATPase
MKQAALLIQNETMASAICSRLKEKEISVTRFTDSDDLERGVSLETFEQVIISDEWFSPRGWEELLDRLFRLSPELRITALLTERAERRVKEAYWKSCLSRRIEVIHSAQGPQESARRAVQAMTDDANTGAAYSGQGGRLLVFIGSTPNSGTTLVSFGTAVRLAAETTCTVGYVCLNLKSSKIHRYVGRDDPACTLDGLRAELRSSSLRPDRLIKACETFPHAPNLYVLAGNMIREQAEFFSVDDMEFLLQTAAQTFDIVIVEVNAYWDNAATVTAVCKADRRFYVTGGDLAQFQEDTRRWLYSLSPMLELDPASFELVVNGLEPAVHSGIRAKDVAQETGIQLLACIHRHPEAGLAANEGRLFEFFWNPSGMGKELSGLVEVLAGLYQLPRTAQAPRRRWSLGLPWNTTVPIRARG